VPTVGPASASPAGQVPTVTPALAAQAVAVSKAGKAVTKQAPATSQAFRDARLIEIGTNCCVGTTVLNGSTDTVVLVVAVTQDTDVTWLLDVPYKAYLVSNVDANGFQRLQNPEHATAGSYISWLIQNYAALPQNIAFINSRRVWPFAWRERIDDVISNLSLPSLTFHPLASRWYATHYDTQSIRDISTFLSPVEPNLPISSVPENGANYAYGCCNTFAVSNTTAQHLSLDSWMKLYWWLESHPRTQRKRFTLEFSWHVLFGMPAEMTAPDPRTFCPTNPALCQTFLDVGSKGTSSELAFHSTVAARIAAR
jgi:hypothetical protein